ncbi:zinc finger protein 33B-like isoform X1 [Schistocerca piceifrons]|uniref:zinc finger protein 33B-like isoform X1 n=1 Tax=Schistocerca piceifrons TaxID=274613 RepID=UPI001F5EB88F|nr:zinc finger protein 33B-like isoform X1 [Schistocerca piceifrons]
MSVSCALKSCVAHEGNHDTLELHFFPFPEDAEISELWIKKCNRFDLLGKPYSEIHRTLYLCERHFSEDAFESPNVLKPNAEPSVLIEDITSTLNLDKPGNTMGPEVVVIPYTISASEEEIVEYGGGEIKEEEQEVAEIETRYEIAEGDVYIEPLGENTSEQGEQQENQYEIIDENVFVSQETGQENNETAADDSNINNCLEIQKSNVVGIIVEENSYDRDDWQQGQDTALANILCRICASEEIELVPVFGEKGEELQLIEKIKWHLPIEVREDDKLPLQICITCIDKLNSCHELVSSCLEADAKLRKLFCIEDEESIEKRNDILQSFSGMEAEHAERRSRKKNYSYSTTDGIEDEHQFEEGDGEESEDSSRLKMNHAYQIVDSAGETEDGEMLQMNVTTELTECDPGLKSKIAGAMKDIMVKDDGPQFFNNEEENAIWRCDMCDYEASKKSVLINHIRKRHAAGAVACNYCEKYFFDEESAKLHERTHLKSKEDESEPPMYMCEFCGKSFRGRKSLKEHHLANHSEVKPFKCDQCDKNYGSLASLDIHKATHSTETPYLCDLCGKSFKHINNLRSHKRCHMDDSYKNRQLCTKCGKGFRSKFHLNEHMNVHNGVRPYSCEKCGKRFHKKIQLRQHGSAHLGEQPFSCHICGVKFNRRGNMTQHIKRHEHERKYTCRVCNESFPTLGAVLTHRKLHTDLEVEKSIQMQAGDDPEQAAFKCVICGKLLVKKESLATHMRSHTGEKLFECTVCGKKLSNKGSLTYHMRSFHTGERPHTCQFCGEGFLSKEARLVHERIHTGEKPYKCSVCGMAFRCSSNLSQHIKVHSEERPHPCQHCGKAFQRKGALDVHMRTHTGERPFTCDICGRGFTQKNDMLKHRRIHTQEKPFRCDQCGQLFMQKRDLTKHLSLHAHKQEVVEEEETPTQTVVITTADNNVITFPEIPVNVPVMENTQAVILHRF